MRIGVLGTGAVGRAIATRLVQLGHEVTMGSRSADGEALKEWIAEAGEGAKGADFATAAADSELLFNCTAGIASLAALDSAGAENLAGKTLVDVAVPLDFSAGFPPSLAVCNDDSLGEQIQAAFPQVKVVKTLNTLTAALMVRPTALANGDHTVFVSGNDAGAKETVIGILESFGHTDVIDLGDISTARGAEMVLPLWLRLMGAVNTPMFNLKVVR